MSDGNATSVLAPYQLTKQRLYMFEQMSAPRFSVTPEFIAVRSPYAASSNANTWGFVLNTNASTIRKSDLYELKSVVQDAVVTTITGTVHADEESYSVALS